jgi:hypothetical protein
MAVGMTINSIYILNMKKIIGKIIFLNFNRGSGNRNTAARLKIILHK